MEPSILTSTKKVLGIAEDYTAFDPDIVMHINSALATLTQLGIGPENGFTIEDDEAVWATFIGTDPRLNAVKTYVYLKVRMVFDPPTTSYLLEAFNKQIQEHEWRLNAYREDTAWVDPTVLDDLELGNVLDGGPP